MKPGDLVPLAGPVGLVAGQRQGRFPFCHGVYLDGPTPTLVDPGCGDEALAAFGARHPVARIINTHSHADHSAGNALFPAAEIWSPREARGTAGSMDRLSVRFMETGPLAERWKSFVTRVMNFREYQPTAYYGPGQVWDDCGARLEAMHTPGHAADHYCLWLPELGVLLAADLDVSPFGPWYGHRESHLGQLRDSIARMRRLAPAMLVPAHMAPLERGIDRALADFAAVLDRRQESLLALLAVERTLAELVDASPIYGGRPYEPELLAYWEGQMILLHLREMAEAGLVEPIGAGWRARRAG